MQIGLVKCRLGVVETPIGMTWSECFFDLPFKLFACILLIQREDAHRFYGKFK